MNYDDYKLQVPETFGGLYDDFTECSCCGDLVSPHNINETELDIWLCGQCFSKWEDENAA